MKNHYFVKDEDGLFRMFDVSHDGLEDAIEVANEVGTDVMRERDGEVELAWSFEESGSFDADALASAGWGTDEDYGGSEDWASDW